MSPMPGGGPADKEGRLWAVLTQMGSVCVAFSGGVDSTYLLHVAHEVLDEGCTAVIAVSPSLPASALEHSRQFCRDRSIPLREVESKEFENPEYVANDARRCYHCKVELARILARVAAEKEAGFLVYGAVTDDLGDYRPGMEAAEEHGVRAPMIEAGLSKQDVRILSQAAGIPGWDRPASACLASRIPYGVQVTPERLAMVERAEEALHEIGFRLVRVRHFGKTARVELGKEELARVKTGEDWETLAAIVRSAGYTEVELDPRGYRAGSLNELIKLDG